MPSARVSGNSTFQYNDRGQMVRRDRFVSKQPPDIIEWHELEYDDKGNIFRIYTCHPDGQRVLQFERATRKTSLKARKKDLLAGLTAAIVEGIRKAHITDEVYVLVVRHDGACLDHALPPLIGLNTVPERTRLMQEHGDYGMEASWNPCEWNQDWAELDYTLSPELAALCESVNQDVWQNERDEDIVRFLFQLLTALYKADLPIRRHENFVAVVLFMGESELTEQVDKQLAPKVSKSLRKAGWLPA